MPENKTLTIMRHPAMGLLDEEAELVAVALIDACVNGQVTDLIIDGRVRAAIVPATRCTACNRRSRTMRRRGDMNWCGRTTCLMTLREAGWGSSS